jgi:hypothetical protein
MEPMAKLFYLLQDPRPDLDRDSKLWIQLFRSIPRLPDRQAAIVLSPRLWYLRAWGTEIRRDLTRREFVPVIDPVNGWESTEEYQRIKLTYLKPYAAQIHQLLYSLE